MIIACRYGDFVVPGDKDLIVNSLRHYGEWAQAEIDVLAHFITEGHVVVDVGAFVGTHARAFSTMVGLEGKVHAFEPNTVIYSFLEENAANSSFSNIAAYPFGLGSKNEKMASVNAWDGANQGAFRLERNEGGNVEQIVDVKSLDSLGLGEIDFIKADVEGMELRVLIGGEKTIETYRPAIFIEINSLEASYGILNWARQRDYFIYGVITSAFNPDNFNRAESDIFEQAKECGLLLIHSQKLNEYCVDVDRLALPEIKTADDIALLLLHKPQYPYEILEKLATAEKLGIDYLAPSLVKTVNEFTRRITSFEQTLGERDIQLENLNKIIRERDVQLENLNRIIGERDIQLENLNKIIRERDIQIGDLGQVVGECNNQIANLNQVVNEYAKQMGSIISSKSWILTKPLRFLDRFVRVGGGTLPTLLRNNHERKTSTSRANDEERLRTSVKGVFDVSFYLKTYPDIAALSVDPLDHFLTIGWQEGRNPNLYFDTNYYLLKNPDIAIANINPLLHYVEHGWREGRNPSRCFDTKYYLSDNSDVADADINPLQHYIDHGSREGRSSYMFFDEKYYLENNPDIRSSGVNPLIHFMEFGWREGRSPGIYFDINFYLSQNPDIAEAEVNPLIHFVEFGWLEGRNPNPYFNINYYLLENSAVADSGMNPLLHFIKQGWQNGCNPNPDFDVDYYISAYPDAVRSGDNPLRHYIETGRSSGYMTFPAKQRVNGVVKDTFVSHEKQKYVSEMIYDDIKRRIKHSTIRIKNTPQCVKITEDTIADSIENLSFNSWSNPEVSIIIPVFNCLQMLVECLVSIKKYVRIPFEIIIADDCSDDTRIQAMFENHQTVKYIRNEVNVGFLRNVNNSISCCSGEFIFLLNSDVQLLDDCVSVLVSHLQTDPDAMVSGPKIIYPNGILQEAGGCIRTDCSTVMTGNGHSAEDTRYGFNRYVDYISGACLCFEKENFILLGKFDESYSPAYAEDLEFCARVIKMGKKVLYVAETTIVHRLSASSEAVSEDFKIYQSAVNKQKFREGYSTFFKKENRIKPIAFYLPQFHSIKENSYWWGEGYTEWREVANARPLFHHHYQPHIPADLGFYDLDTHKGIFEKQAALARRYGIHGFCFYYYNFGNFELLEKPLERFLRSEADIQFCLCWANENWTRTWDGRENDILCKQNEDADGDFLAVLKGMERYVHDSRYITVDKKPLVLIYRAELIGNIRNVTRSWRKYWKDKYKGELYLCLVDSMGRSSGSSISPEELGFDAAVEFPVHHVNNTSKLKISDELENVRFEGMSYDYTDAVVEICSRKHPGYKRFPGVFPSWDNTPRRGNTSTVFRNAHPSSFQVFLENKCEEAKLYSRDERLLFVNAWNEWGEGAHLEPDIEYGHTWLQVIEKVVRENQ